MSSAVLLEEIAEAEAAARQAIEAAADSIALEQVRIAYLGKKGRLVLVRKAMGRLPAGDRPRVGEAVNRVLAAVEAALAHRAATFQAADMARRLREERADMTLPGRRVPVSQRHPLTRTLADIGDIFARLGFAVARGPEIETDYYNFEALNIPRDHPARDMQDTFYLSGEYLLRTHTSPVQVRVMERTTPPVAVIVPGAVYRRDADISHSPMFHQVEGLLVDRDVTFAHLKGVLTAFVHALFGAGTALRFRPSYFPFTEPSAEVDIRCVICGGSGCRVCGTSGWLEILGAGMVHPAVFRTVGYDPEEYTGCAFGLGVERIAMLRYGIDDIRLFYENDLRFLEQFALPVA